MNFLHKYKNLWFPHITDWSSSYDEKRFKQDWWKMSNRDFLLFHPIAYKYMLFGICSLGTLLFLSLAIWAFIRDNPFIVIFSVLIAFRLAWATIAKIRTWKVRSNINFYDILFREV